MKTQLAITDLTRMQRGCVCIAGYDKEGRCIRPVLPPPGITEASLYADERPIVFPFAVVECDLLFPISQPPHTEDHIYVPSSLAFVRWVKDDKRERLLGMALFESVEAIFEQEIHDDWGFYVMDGTGPRSIGAVIPERIVGVKYEMDTSGKWDYRLQFVDGRGRSYRLKITDLTWHYYCNSLRDGNHKPAQIAAGLTGMLRSCKVYVRIGLARGWAEHPERCHLQVNAIHTFPDYLDGKTFADLRTLSRPNSALCQA
ncbi:MAG: hypothetical protein JXB07_03255 [Anaerolineae bacterium]|nr:hypothetical protein [Anaerolineae bacterium]